MVSANQWLAGNISEKLHSFANKTEKAALKVKDPSNKTAYISEKEPFRMVSANQWLAGNISEKEP